MKKKNVNPNRFYRKGNQVDFLFFKTPKELYYDWEYDDLSLGAKSLYMILSDRLGLSIKNQMADEDGFIFVLYKSKPAQGDTRSKKDKPPEELSLSELLSVSPKSVQKYKEELIRHDLLFEQRTGLGKVNRLYVLKPKEMFSKNRKPMQGYSEKDAFKKNFPALCGEAVSEVTMSPLYQMSSRG